MIKRQTAYIFIFLANLVFLAHAVIPHHYHKEQVCIENTHCTDDGLAHEHATTEHEHEHDGDESSSNCMLKQTVILLSYQSKKDCDCNHVSDNHYHNYFNPNTNTLFEIIPTLLGYVSTPLATLSYSAYITASSGLRAPPAC